MFKQYKRLGFAEARPHIVGEDLHGISVSEADEGNIELPGGMIARNPDNHADQWYIAEDYWKANFEQEPIDEH